MATTPAQRQQALDDAYATIISMTENMWPDNSYALALLALANAAADIRSEDFKAAAPTVP